MTIPKCNCVAVHVDDDWHRRTCPLNRHNAGLTSEQLKTLIRQEAFQNIVRLRDVVRQTNKELVEALKEFQRECPHDDVICHAQDKIYFDGYSHSGIRRYTCLKCKMYHYMDGDWKDSPLVRVKCKLVSKEEYDAAERW